ncbi:MAG: preprotein translocase subunit Sec61beta [Candidatus Woesearchaeota archaeon]
MAKNSVRMPTSHAGITSFSEDAVSKVHIKPQLVLILIGIVIVLVAALHFYGAQML